MEISPKCVHSILVMFAWLPVALVSSTSALAEDEREVVNRSRAALSYGSVASKIADDQKELVDRGRALFYGVGTSGCVVCHGVGGRGDGTASKSLPVSPRDLSQGRYVVDTDKDGFTGTENDLHNILLDGTHKYGSSSGMVAWPELTAADRQALVAFMKTLKDSEGAAGNCKLKCECVPGTRTAQEDVN